MNRIEDERIKFYLQHEARIREWAGLETEVREFVDRFYCSIKDDLDTALSGGKINADGVESFLDEEHPNWPGLGLRRRGWPKGDKDPDVRLEWYRKSARFSRDENLICGVRTTVDCYKRPFTKEACPYFPRRSAWWAAYANVDPPVGDFWENDNLNEYRDDLLKTILKAWRELAPLVDKAVGYPRS